MGRAQDLLERSHMLVAQERAQRRILRETRTAARAAVRRSRAHRRLRTTSTEQPGWGWTMSAVSVDDGQHELRDLHRVALAGDVKATALLVERYTGLAKSIALRTTRGSPDHADDAVQVAMYALLQAISRFDPDRGVAFSTFAHATIDGELKRYRRRTAWSVHVPRRLQELYLEASVALDDLAHRLGRQPTIAELADTIGAGESDVVEVLEFRHLQHPMSLDVPVGHDDHPGTGREVRDDEVGFPEVEQRDLVRRLLERLEDRDRQIIELRFMENLTQSEIADRVGLSQMHVSRLLRAALDRLRVLAVDRS